MSGAVHIGTSGWHYDHWRGPFYPPDLPVSGMLAYYARFFSDVEINNSFYRLPTASTLESWRDTTPADFSFAAKASRYLTHMKKLKDPEAGLERLLPRLEVLGARLGPILFQLPPRWRCDVERLAAFLDALPAEHRYAFELRDPSWHVPAVYALLAEHRAAFCIYDLAGFQSPNELTTDFTYIRLNGPAGAYQGSYSDEALAVWAGRVRGWRPHLRAMHIYFDNDDSGYAVRNALALRARIAAAETSGR